MSETALALMDTGETNRRILSKDEYRADFRRVEAASLKRRTCLASGEGKRMFARCFYSFQASMYFISTLGRTKLPLEQIEQLEQVIRTKLEDATKELNQAIDGAELLFKNHGIECVATYDTVPLEVEIGITSALGRRYFELMQKLDQAMPLLQTLEIEEVISEKQAELQRSRYKRIVLSMSTSARNFSMGVRRRMNEADSRAREAEEKGRKGRPPVAADLTGESVATANEAAVELNTEAAVAEEAVVIGSEVAGEVDSSCGSASLALEGSDLSN